MYIKHCLWMIIMFIFPILAICQEKEIRLKYGDVKPADFEPSVYSIDSTADAIYLYNVASANYEGNSKGWFSVDFTVHQRIRLLHKKSFDNLATIRIPYVQDAARIEKIKAATYNIKDGQVITTELDKNSFFTEKDGGMKVIKFAFPNLQEGSIIEFSFTMSAPVYYGNEFIPGWDFQNYYPELWNEYTIEVPEFLNFITLQQGYLTPVTDTVKKSSQKFLIFIPNGFGMSRNVNLNSNTISHTWAYKNIPAIKKDEKFISNINNYKQHLEFQLYSHTFPGMGPEYFMKSWNETADELMKSEYFGAGLTAENGWLKDDVKAAIKNDTGQLKKVRSIYEWVCDNYTCIDTSSLILSQPIRKTEQLKKGNVADINLLLIAMLKNAGYDANPVILCTKKHGIAFDLYPILSKYNYVIVQVMVNDKQYLLDASDPLIGFNHLSADCYNGNARLITNPSAIVNLSADSLHENEVTSMFIVNDSNGNILGTYKHVMGKMQSYDLRSKMKQISKEDYFEDEKKSFSFEVSLKNATIDSLSQHELPVTVKYNISFKPEGNILYFSPILASSFYKTNPFPSEQRFFPVEMPFCINKTYILNMEVPSGYTVDELPKPEKANIYNNEGVFNYLIQQNGNTIQLMCQIKINKTTFDADDYETLRSFFNIVVEKESEQIVFKKL